MGQFALRESNIVVHAANLMAGSLGDVVCTSTRPPFVPPPGAARYLGDQLKRTFRSSHVRLTEHCSVRRRRPRELRWENRVLLQSSVSRAGYRFRPCRNLSSVASWVPGLLMESLSIRTMRRSENFLHFLLQPLRPRAEVPKSPAEGQRVPVPADLPERDPGQLTLRLARHGCQHQRPVVVARRVLPGAVTVNVPWFANRVLRGARKLPLVGSNQAALIGPAKRSPAILNVPPSGRYAIASVPSAVAATVT